MITLEKACQNALYYFKRYWGETAHIQFIQDIGDAWIITPDADEDFYGIIPVSVNKNTGELKAYPTQQHFDLLKKVPKIKINPIKTPKEAYKIARKIKRYRRYK
ncbi:MAG: hypothetical protein K2J39_11480, partial [Ruminococcus sp.]|nr:hypothetical protein [Ruminococcus sp.]